MEDDSIPGRAGLMLAKAIAAHLIGAGTIDKDDLLDTLRKLGSAYAEPDGSSPAADAAIRVVEQIHITSSPD